MRAASNLAGVEFIAPPRYLNESIRNLWAEIITESGYFFTRDAMRFFSSRVVWDSLTHITQDTYGFITSEQNQFLYFEPEPRRYTVRKWTKENGIRSLSEFQEFETLKAAKHYLTNAGWDRGGN
jgi:hypothetical protein